MINYNTLAGTATAYNEVNNNTLYLWKNRLIAIDQLKNDLFVALSGRDHAALRAYIGPGGAVGGYLPAASGPTQINSMLNNLTSSTLYNLNHPDHFNTLQQQGAPDKGYHAIDEKNTFIYFQNGMDNATNQYNLRTYAKPPWQDAPTKTVHKQYGKEG